MHIHIYKNLIELVFKHTHFLMHIRNITKLSYHVKHMFTHIVKTYGPKRPSLQKWQSCAPHCQVTRTTSPKSFKYEYVV